MKGVAETEKTLTEAALNQEKQDLTVAQTGQQWELQEKTAAEAELIRRKTENPQDYFPPSAGSKPPTISQKLAENDKITASFEDIIYNDMPGLATTTDADGNVVAEMPIDPANKAYMRNLYDDAIDFHDGDVDKARDMIANETVILQDYGSWGAGDNAQYIVPKAFIQMVAESINDEPTKDEIIQAWKLKLAQERGAR